ncbi:MAG: GNAT family N-acetyltransferase [Candidatus Latescibacteria bacterium]|nr:GNAT family N-acetyltransferase [Candidatus Latescibacterota bacterium]
MKVIDLTEEHEPLFFCCLEDWSEEIKEAGSHKELWYSRMKEEGLRVKLAEDDSGVIGGMIQYLPIKKSHVEGDGLYFIYCIWVHGYKKGRGNFQKRGMGKALLKAAEEDAGELGAKGMAAWGVSLPFWMKASWFRKQGYKPADKDGMAQLLWKPFTEDASPPRWIVQKKKPEPVPGKVTVTSFMNGWCPAQNMVFERAKRAAAGFGDTVEFQEFNTSETEVLQEWGLIDALFIDGRQVRTGPPPSYEKIRKKIRKKVRKL